MTTHRHEFDDKAYDTMAEMAAARLDDVHESAPGTEGKRLIGFIYVGVQEDGSYSTASIVPAHEGMGLFTRTRDYCFEIARQLDAAIEADERRN